MTGNQPARRLATHTPTHPHTAVILLATILPTLAPARADTPDPWLVDAQNIAASIKKHPAPHQVVVVFDVSGSMRSQVPETSRSRWQEARAATSEVLTSALQPGDSLTILPFDSIVHPPQPYPNIQPGKIQSIGQAIPDAITGESGTNMRLAHDQALQILRRQYDASPAGKRPWQAVVVVSDGFNDQPPLHSAAWQDYAKYCNVHSDNQNLYPDTPECRQWRTLARQFRESGEGETFGIGVKIKDDVPEYRPPNEKPEAAAGATPGADAISGIVYSGAQPAAGARVQALNAQGGLINTAQSGPDGTFTIAGLAPGSYTIEADGAGGSALVQGIPTGNNTVNLHMTHSLVWLYALLAVLVVVAILAGTLISKSRRASKVRIQIKDSSGRNRTFWLGGGTVVSIGGKESPGAFPMEVFSAPVAQLRHTSSGYSVMTEKDTEVETGGRKFTGFGPVSENSIIRLRNGAGAEGTFEFRDISSRTRAAAGADTSGASTGDAYSRLDASLKG